MGIEVPSFKRWIRDFQYFDQICGNIFGGFTEHKWYSNDDAEDSEEDFVRDPKAFIFSLVNKEEKSFKAMCSNKGKVAIYCHSEDGPGFGEKYIDIKTNSNVKKDSYCDSYQHPDYLKWTAKADNILAGSNFFETIEIEVYAKSNHFKNTKFSVIFKQTNSLSWNFLLVRFFFKQ